MRMWTANYFLVAVSRGFGASMKVLSFENARSISSDLLMRLEELARSRGIQQTPFWFRILEETCAEPGDRFFHLCAVDDNRAPHAYLPLRHSPKSQFFPGAREFHALSSPYTTEFRPLLPRNSTATADLMRALKSHCGRFDLIHFEALVEDDPAYAVTVAALRGAGFIVHDYKGFENWYEPVAGRDFHQYWARRPGRLRNTHTRKRKALEKQGKLRIDIFPDCGEPERLLSDYQRVYDNSWKEPEPYPRFTSTLIREAAQAGMLRMGVLYLDDTPLAADIWLVSAGRATIFKLAYDESAKKLSPGTVLTAAMMEHVLTRDEVDEVDFGRGPDSYKKDWLGQLRHRRGLIAFNRTPTGLLAAANHIGRARIKSLIKGRK